MTADQARAANIEYLMNNAQEALESADSEAAERIAFARKFVSEMRRVLAAS